MLFRSVGFAQPFTIHHRTADRVRAHIFLCMLAYYVEWHMREAWRELTFADTEIEAKATRDPVAPAKRSRAALLKAARHTLDDGTPVNSFSTLMDYMLTIVRSEFPRNTSQFPVANLMSPYFDGFRQPLTPRPGASKQKHARISVAVPQAFSTVSNLP